MLSPSHVAGWIRHQRDAFSLIEMLVTLSVAAALVMLGVPSMAHWLHALEIRSSANELVSVLQGARSEAVARNQDVRVTLGDAQGRAVWTLGCVTVTAACPRKLRGADAAAARLARWGATHAVGAPALSVPLPVGQQLPAQVTFNALGAAPAIGSGTEISRIDILDAADASVPRLVVLLGTNGMVRLCDPVAGIGGPLSCT